MIGKRLKELRKARGLTLNRVSIESGISISQLSKMENDLSDNPTLSTITELAKIYDVSIASLIVEDADGNPLTPDELRLIDLWRAQDYADLLTFISEAMRDNEIQDRSGWSVRSAGWYSDNESE